MRQSGNTNLSISFDNSSGMNQNRSIGGSLLGNFSKMV